MKPLKYTMIGANIVLAAILFFSFYHLGGKLFPTLGIICILSLLDITLDGYSYVTRAGNIGLVVCSGFALSYDDSFPSNSTLIFLSSSLLIAGVINFYILNKNKSAANREE